MGVAGPLIVNGLADIQASAGAQGADLYELSLFIMVGILVIGFIANLLIRPVAESHWASADAPSEAAGVRSRKAIRPEPRVEARS